eukprot:9482092-Alexandrium_andersonii.AAC.1
MTPGAASKEEDEPGWAPAGPGAAQVRLHLPSGPVWLRAGSEISLLEFAGLVLRRKGCKGVLEARSDSEPALNQ